ncbi:hypothetical protein Droror1_Dr00014830 [Drosera rotundifolia]
MASQVAFEGVPRRTRSSKRAKRSIKVKKELEDASYELDPPPGFHKKYSELTGGDSRKNDQDRQTKMLKTTQQLDYGQRNEKANAFVSKSWADQSSSLFPLRKKRRMLHMILMHLQVSTRSIISWLMLISGKMMRIALLRC